MTITKCFLGVNHHHNECCIGPGSCPRVHDMVNHYQSCCVLLSTLTAEEARDRQPKSEPQSLTRHQIFQTIEKVCYSTSAAHIQGKINAEDVELLRSQGYDVTVNKDHIVIKWNNSEEPPVANELHSSLLEQHKNEINPLKGCDSTNIEAALEFLKSTCSGISFRSESCSAIIVGGNAVKEHFDIVWKRNLPPEGPPESPSLSILLDSLCSQIECEINPLNGCDSTNINEALKFLKDQYPDITFASKTSFANVGGVNSVVIEWYRKENIIDSLEKQLSDGINPLEAGTSQDINTTINILKANHPELIFNHKFISVGTSGCVQNGIEWKRIEQPKEATPSPLSRLFDSLVLQIKNKHHPLIGCNSLNIDTVLHELKLHYPNITFIPKVAFVTSEGHNIVDIYWDCRSISEEMRASLEKQLSDEINPLTGCEDFELVPVLIFLKKRYPGFDFTVKPIKIESKANPAKYVIEWKRLEQPKETPTAPKEPQDFLTLAIAKLGLHPVLGQLFFEKSGMPPEMIIDMMSLPDTFPKDVLKLELEEMVGPEKHHLIDLFFADKDQEPDPALLKALREFKPSGKQPKEEKVTAPSATPPPLPKATKVYAEVLLQQLINKLKLSPLATPLLKFIPDEFILAIAPMIINIPDEIIVTFKTALFKLIPPEYHPMVRIAWP